MAPFKNLKIITKTGGFFGLWKTVETKLIIKKHVISRFKYMYFYGSLKV
jgi:hypothetical protein